MYRYAQQGNLTLSLTLLAPSASAPAHLAQFFDGALRLLRPAGLRLEGCRFSVLDQDSLDMLFRTFGLVDVFHRNPTDTWLAASVAAAFADLLLLSSCFRCFAARLLSKIRKPASVCMCQALSSSVCLKLREYSLNRNPPDSPAPDPPAPERPSRDHQKFRAFSLLVLKISLFLLHW